MYPNHLKYNYFYYFLYISIFFGGGKDDNLQ